MPVVHFPAITGALFIPYSRRPQGAAGVDNLGPGGSPAEGAAALRLGEGASAGVPRRAMQRSDCAAGGALRLREVRVAGRRPGRHGRR